MRVLTLLPHTFAQHVFVNVQVLGRLTRGYAAPETYKPLVEPMRPIQTIGFLTNFRLDASLCEFWTPGDYTHG